MYGGVCCELSYNVYVVHFVYVCIGDWICERVIEYSIYLLCDIYIYSYIYIRI